MKFGIHSLLFSETFLDKDLARLEKIRAMGFDAVEIIPFDPKGFPAAKTRRIAADLGLDINTGYGLPADKNIISPDPAIRRAGIDFSKYLLDLSVEAGAKVYTGLIHCGWGYLTGRMRTDDEWNWGVDAFREIAEYAVRNAPGLILGVEVVNRFETHFLNTAEDAVRYVHAVDQPNVKVHLDSFHMIREEESFRGAVLMAGADLGYVHACESHRGMLGRGLVPWPEFFAALAEVRYDGCITLESFDPDMSGIAKLCCIWRKLLDSPEQFATEGLAFVRETARLAGLSVAGA